MKRVILSLFIIPLFVIFAGFLSTKTTNAAVADCGAGFETTGCFYCQWNDSIFACGESPRASDCAPGYQAPSDRFTACGNVTDSDPGQCNRPQACTPVAAPPLTKIFCQSNSCAQCDNIAGNATPDCPSGVTLWDDYAGCAPNCLITEPNQCQNVHPTATCKSACSADETVITGNSCANPSDACCLPNDVVGEPGTGTQPVNFPTCNTGSSTGAIRARGIPTAIGCIPIENASAIAIFFVRWGVGIIGGIALLLIIIASIMIITSTGDPKRLQAGKELMTAALSGIILIIFSFFVLRILGVHILQIPFFGG